MTQTLHPGVQSNGTIFRVCECMCGCRRLFLLRAEAKLCGVCDKQCGGSNGSRAHGEVSHVAKVGIKVFLISGMKKKPTHIAESRTTYLIDGRWYWSDGTAVDGSAMRWEERE